MASRERIHRASCQSHNAYLQANDRDSPKELLTTLSKSTDELLRGAVALNPSTPTEILEELLKDTSSYVLNCLRKRGYQTRPVFSKPKTITGNKLVFRNATTTDAAFILELRTHEKKSAYISKTSSDLRQQEIWLEKYGGTMLLK